MHLQENTLFDLDLGVKFTRNAAYYPLNHVTYAATKFEVATSNSLNFRRRYIYKKCYRRTGRRMMDQLKDKKKTGIITHS